MITQFLIIVILYLILNQVIQYYNDISTKNNSEENMKDKVSTKEKAINLTDKAVGDDDDSSSSDSSSDQKKKKNKYLKSSKPTVSPNLFGEPHDYKPGQHIVWIFNDSIPWSQIIYLYNQDYPFKFYIKVKIPSLNDYQSWKEVIPNLDFDARTGELIIPSKNEASALAVANLILSTFKGNLKLETILEKGLIQISVAKAQQFELVKNKLRDQIIEVIQGKSKSSNQSVGNSDFEADLATSNIKESNSFALEEFSANEPAAATANDGYSYI